MAATGCDGLRRAATGCGAALKQTASVVSGAPRRLFCCRFPAVRGQVRSYIPAVRGQAKRRPVRSHTSEASSGPHVLCPLLSLRPLAVTFLRFNRQTAADAAEDVAFDVAGVGQHGRDAVAQRGDAA